jgi:site-specific recombinase XerD
MTGDSAKPPERPVGYIYRPKLKGNGGRLPEGMRRCPDPRHAKCDECPTCGARFSAVWWAKYYANGTPVRESTGTESETEAPRFLKAREGGVVTGQQILPRVGRIRYEEAAEDLRTYYKATGERDTSEVEWRLAHLDEFFETKRLAGIGSADIMRYVVKRQGEGASNATINRDLAVLNRMLRLAYENGTLVRLPLIHKLKESKPREGFFERPQFEAVKRHLRPDLQLAVSIQYAFGWRGKKEVLTLKRKQVNLGACTLRLEPGTTKNEEGRVVYLTPELVELIQAQEERIQLLEMHLGHRVPWLFPHLTGKHKGERIRDFRRAWKTALLNAMLDGLEAEERARRKAELEANPEGLVRMLRHDFRRTAVRNMVNRGVPERVAMMITGHKTRSVFDRYHIVSPGDLQDAARKLAGTFSGTLLEKKQGVRVQPPDFLGGRRWFRTTDPLLVS